MIQVIDPGALRMNFTEGIIYSALSPLMRQYFEIKKQFSDAIVLFQVGDFYEIFFEDAQKAASFLGIVLTQRGTLQTDRGSLPIPLCGVPRHTAEHYIIKLVKGGFRVVLCDQLEPAQAGKVVERGVTQVFTPGTLIDSKLIESKSAHYLAALVKHIDRYGLVFYEMLTGQLFVTTFAIDEKILDAELMAFVPQEVVLFDTAGVQQLEHMLHKRGFVTTRMGLEYAKNHATAWVNDARVLGSFSHEWFVLQATCMDVLGLLYAYLQKHAPYTCSTEHSIMWYQPDEYMQLDAMTQKNLELVKNNYDNSLENTVFSVIDGAVTGMGSRRIKKWLLRPLLEYSAIVQRQNSIEYFVQNTLMRNDVRTAFKVIGDIERIIGRIVLRRAQFQDYAHLRDALRVLPQLASLMTCDVTPLYALYHQLDKALSNDSTVEWKIATGYHDELDRLRALAVNGMQAVAELERAEQEATGIGSLKIRHTQHGGYAIEVTKTYTSVVPGHYMHLQSLTNRDRFTIQALKDLEYDIQRAHSAHKELEETLFAHIVQDVYALRGELKKMSDNVADLDAFAGLADVAVRNHYIKPMFNNDGTLNVSHGRHLVVEARIKKNAGTSPFMPNGVTLSPQSPTWIITGPNMGGKSTFLRQTALHCILAQMGSFIPADAANLPLIDRVFTRIGAGDHLAHGKSTFLVEMEETAVICQQATNKSLVILDEVGRGTSTFDGLALAQSIVEYLHYEIRPYCLFATHYHELTQLCSPEAGIVAYHAASKQVHDTILLTHKILPGVALGSFGIQVAIAAHIPDAVIKRAKQLLHQLETQGNSLASKETLFAPAPVYQEVVEQVSPVLRMLQEVDLENTTPRQAYDILCSLRESL